MARSDWECAICQGASEGDGSEYAICATCAALEPEASVTREALGKLEREPRCVRAKSDSRYRDYLAASRARDIAASLLRSDLDEMGF